MIGVDEVKDYATLFGTPVESVLKDHAISHVLHGLSQVISDSEKASVVFYGGTALNRTLLHDFRLSEDIDLIVESYPEWIETMKSVVQDYMRNEFPDAHWERESTYDGVWTVHLVCTQNTEVQVQCVKPRARWEYYKPHLVTAPVKLRYSDLPESAEFMVPNSDAFVAMKLCAWIDRYTPRDLADLAELANHGYITRSALDLARDVYGIPFTTSTLGRTFPPRVEREWESALTHQAAAMRTMQESYDKLIAAVQKIEDEQ